MSAALEAISNKPIAYFQCDSSTFKDRSGYGRNGIMKGGTSTNTAPISVALASGTAYSSVFDTSHIGQFDCPVFTQGNESKPFSLEAWIYPIQRTSGITTQRENYVLNAAPSSTNNLQGIGSGSGTITYVADNSVPSGSGGYGRRTASVAGSVGFGSMTNSLSNGQYTASFWVRSSNASPTIYFEGTATKSPYSAGYTSTVNQWTRVSLTFNITAPGTIKVGAYMPSAAANDTIDMTGFMLETGAAMNSYFDGNSTGAKWSGTAGNSESYLLVSDGEQQILGHDGQMDGLTINGTVISFVTKYATTGEARATYDLQIPRKAYVVGVHTAQQNLLYVDSELVSSVDISTAQQADTYVTTTNYVYSGETTSSRAVALNGVGIYSTALNANSIMNVFNVGSSHATTSDVPFAYGGTRIPLSVNQTDVFLEHTWTTASDWTTGTTLNTIGVQEDSLVPNQDTNGVSVAGSWLDIFSLDAANTTSIYGVNLTWDGVGAIVEASVDGGTTWVTATRGVNLSNIAPGFNPTGKTLEIRVSFPGGITGDTSYLDNLTVRGFRTGSATTIANRTVTFTAPAYVKDDYDPALLRNDWGVELGEGYVVIGSDTSAVPMTPATIEVWLKRNDTNSFYIDGRSVSGDTTNFVLGLGEKNWAPTRVTAAYINGQVRNTQYLNVGDWAVIHIVPNSPLSGPLYINTAQWGSQVGLSTGSITVGQVVLYPTALTAAQVNSIYQGYVGKPLMLASQVSSIGVTKPANAANIYGYDWSITSNG